MNDNIVIAQLRATSDPWTLFIGQRVVHVGTLDSAIAYLRSTGSGYNDVSRAVVEINLRRDTDPHSPMVRKQP